MSTFRSMWRIFNLQTVAVVVFAVASTHLCWQWGITADFPLTLIGVAIVFPVVFSIGGAYKRRENALAKYSSIKAHGRAIFFASRDWLENTDEKIQGRAKELLGELLIACRTLFAHPVSEMAPHEEKVYRIFSRLSACRATSERAAASDR